MIIPGYCMICGAKTHAECPTCGVKKVNGQYTEVEVSWSNGAWMRIGVCVECAATNAHTKPENKKKIEKAHHDHWRNSDRSVTLV